MVPEPLRCETRRRATGMGMWRYSMAAVIVVAAMLDVFWWVPTQHARRAERRDAIATEQVRARMPRCRASQIQQELAAIDARRAALQAELDALVAAGAPHATDATSAQ